MYPAGIITTGRTITEYAYYGGVMDYLGSSHASGSLMGTQSKTVANLFESEEYFNYLQTIREWYNAGYIHPDVATSDSNETALVASGVFNGYFMVSAPIQKMGAGASFGTDQVDVIQLSEPFYASIAAGGWVVPITSAEPEAAVRFLDLVWGDPDVANLIQWGIEGVHYVMLDEEELLIGFPEGIDANNSGYYNTLGLYGDKREIYIWDLSAGRSENASYTERAMANPTQGAGFMYVPSDNQTARISAIEAVMAQYLPALESGSVDLDIYYPEFIEALKSAGIEEVMKDKQDKFDAWCEENGK